MRIKLRLMKTAALFLLSVVASAPVYAQDFFDKALDERVESNKQLTAELVEETKGMEEAETIAAIETQNGEDWVELLKHIKNKKDPKLSYLMLRTEIQAELVGAYYDFEFPEGLMARMKAKGKIKRYQKQLEELEAAYKKSMEDEKKASK